MIDLTYTAICPDGPIPAPAPTPEETAKFAVHIFAGSTGLIICHPRDYAALQSTAVAERVKMGTATLGYPQAGTLWVEVED